MGQFLIAKHPLLSRKSNLNKFFGLGKFISLVAIIVGGIYFAVTGKADLSIWYPENLFSPIYSEKSVLTGLGFAFYQAMWSYDGEGSFSEYFFSIF